MFSIRVDNFYQSILPRGLNKGFSSKFRGGSGVRQEGRKAHRPKCCEYNDEDENDRPNILNDEKTDSNGNEVWFGFMAYQQSWVI